MILRAPPRGAGGGRHRRGGRRPHRRLRAPLPRRRQRPPRHPLLPLPPEPARVHAQPRRGGRGALGPARRAAGYPMPEGTRHILARLFPELERDERDPHPRGRGEPGLALGHHLHCLVAQIPVRLRARSTATSSPTARRTGRVALGARPRGRGDRRFRKLHFLVFPEGCLPARPARRHARRRRASDPRPNTVTMFGLEHVPLRTFRDAPARASATTTPGRLALVEQDLASGRCPAIPVNLSCVVVKEDDGTAAGLPRGQGPPLPRRGVPRQEPRPLPGAPLLPLPRPAGVLQLHGPHLPRLPVPGPLRLQHPAHRRPRQPALLPHPPDARRALRHPVPTPSRSTAPTGTCSPGSTASTWRTRPGVRDTVTVFGNCSDESHIEGGEGHGASASPRWSSGPGTSWPERGAVGVLHRRLRRGPALPAALRHRHAPLLLQPAAPPRARPALRPACRSRCTPCSGPRAAAGNRSAAHRSWPTSGRAPTTGERP